MPGITIDNVEACPFGADGGIAVSLADLLQVAFAGGA